MAKIPIHNKYPNLAGYMTLNTETNNMEVMSDGKNIVIPQESDTIIKSAKKIFESQTGEFYGLHNSYVIHPTSLVPYIIARKGTVHTLEDTSIVKRDLLGNETVIHTETNMDFRDGFAFYYNNHPRILFTRRQVSPDETLNPIITDIVGNIVAEAPLTITGQTTSYIQINNNIYFYTYNTIRGQIIEYNPDTNVFTILEEWEFLDGIESEGTMGIINGKKFIALRTDSKPYDDLLIYILNDDWTIKDKKTYSLPYINGKPNIILKKGNKLYLNTVARYNDEPAKGILRTYEITEHNNDFNFIPKKITELFDKDDLLNNNTVFTSYYMPSFSSYGTKGLFLVEDRTGTNPITKTTFYLLDFDENVSNKY